MAERRASTGGEEKVTVETADMMRIISSNADTSVKGVKDLLIVVRRLIEDLRLGMVYSMTKLEKDEMNAHFKGLGINTEAALRREELLSAVATLERQAERLRVDLQTVIGRIKEESTLIENAGKEE